MSRSSTNPKLTLAVSRTDRTWPIIAGDVTVPGYAIDALDVRLEEIFVRQLNDIAFDVAETSLASYLVALDRGEQRLTGIPVFLSRSFRHNAFFVRADSRLGSLEDLRGVRIGVPEFQMTAAIWARKWLRELGIPNDANTWVTYRPERVAIEVQAKRGKSLDIIEGLVEGEVDAAFIVRRPPERDLGLDGSAARIRRLFADPWEAERAYYERTKVFPIMHLVTVRRELVVADPLLPRKLYDMFSQAKAVAETDLHETTYLSNAQPWTVAALETAHRSMGRELWPYGLGKNWSQIAGFVDDLRKDGLLTRDIGVAEIFAESVLDT